jgi:hypothetical protein
MAAPRLSVCRASWLCRILASVGAITPPTKASAGVAGMQLVLGGVPATLCSKRPDASQGPDRMVGRGEASGPRKKARMMRLVSIITGVGVLAMQAAFLIALHLVLR